MPMQVAGGVYREYCTHPRWDFTFGSGGRAAAAIASLQSPVILHTYASGKSALQLQLLQDAYGFQVQSTTIAETIAFEYFHDLAKPDILNVPRQRYLPLQVSGDKVVRFGMLDGDALVTADWAVYDPQNMGAPERFGQNGSTAKHLALVLNQWEARQLAGLPDGDAASCAEAIAKQDGAEVVIIKQGASGALVWAGGAGRQIPAYRTTNVWKLGSGDCFVGYFAHAWMNGQAPVQAALFASKATAYYCETQGFATSAQLAAFQPPEVTVSKAVQAGAERKVYLAGPFFHLAQVWMIEELRTQLRGAGLTVFSPYHDVGLGSAADVVDKDIQAIKECDVMLAVADGLDAGTMFEVGYARSLEMPVVVYSELEKGSEALKMMEGTGCLLCSNLATAVYTTLWEAVRS